MRLSCAIHARRRIRQRFQPLRRDVFAAFATNAIHARVNAINGLLEKSPLFPRTAVEPF
jgi:hypothetical protein